ncbi:MAG: ABC transporter permease subunit [Rhodobacteraceae bacterium]|nr:ABC transporter permease subunit [Paracoccaceae bacterium]
MGAYILRRLLLIIPTLLGIILVNFIVVQFAPGGPVEQALSELQDLGGGSGATDRFTGGGGDGAAASQTGESSYRGSQGLDPELVSRLQVQFGFARIVCEDGHQGEPSLSAETCKSEEIPSYEQFLIMVGNYLTFDFGESFFKGKSVTELIWDKLPVSLTLGFWTFALSYGISIPLGIRKAVRDGTPFDAWTSGVIIVGYAIPNFLLGIMLLIFFAGGSYFQFFPLRGLHSDGWEDFSLIGQLLDYIWHIVLPITALAVGGFATLTLLTKNSFLDEIKKQYVITARAKGLTENRVLYGHVFRNAMLIVIAGFPAAVIGIFFGGSLLIETVFSLDGLGLLGYEAVIQRDYPIVFGTLFIFSLIGLAAHLLTDITYTLIDPRIDFESRST